MRYFGNSGVQPKMIKRAAWVLILLILPLTSLRADSGSPWCGYALIENIPAIDQYLKILSLLTPDETAATNPYELFQSRVSLDDTKAIIEGCWKIFPSREVVVNLLGLAGIEQKSLDEVMTYSLFAPDGSYEDSAASVRAYLQQNSKDWERPCDDLASC